MDAFQINDSNVINELSLDNLNFRENKISEQEKYKQLIDWGNENNIMSNNTNVKFITDNNRYVVSSKFIKVKLFLN